MTRSSYLACAVLLSLVAGGCSKTSENTVELVNNQPFDIRMPLKVRDLKLPAASPVAQQAGDDAVILVDVPASQSRTLALGQAGGVGAQPLAVTLKPGEDGVAVLLDGKDMGRLAWGVVLGKAPKEKTEGFQAPSTKQDFAASFKPVSLAFSRTGEGSLFDTWSASGSAEGLKLDVTLHAYHTGYLDLNATVTNESAPQKDVYAAVVCRWEQKGAAGRTVCYDNRRAAFDDGAYTPFRVGEGRQQMIQRGVDWINTRFADGTGVTWLNDFTPSFTVHRAKTEKTGARWVGANTAQLAQEAQAKGDAIYAITEVARPNIKQYQPRLSENVLPGPDQPLTITYRLAFDAKAVSDDAADNRFVGYVGFNPQQVTKDGAKVTFGVPYTRMGTNYFPFSTLGENFGNLRMEGMSKEGYWPLAPQTVLQWQKFADDIKRDLRTIKAMGYELVRLHHIEVMYDNDPKTGKPYIPAEKRWEYLDFLFKEIETLQLEVLLDVKLPPADVAELVKRYGKHLDGVEYDNEILIFQIYDKDVPVWKAVYDAVKAVDPNMPFHLTAHTNTGAFDRLEKLGVKVDRVGQHTYMDGLDPIPSSRGYALAMGNYAAKKGKEPQVTEWNWRFMTRMPMEERGKVYAPIFENVLKARAMPIMYQFQYQDSLAMNPTTLKGIRRYEQLLLSRRPKPEAFEMMKLIERYAAPDAAVKRVGIDHTVVELTGDTATVEFELTNKTAKPMNVQLSLDPTEGLMAEFGMPKVAVPANGTTRVPVKVSLVAGAKGLPGFYHLFLRAQLPDKSLRYGWAEVRRPGNITLDRSENGGNGGDVKVTYAAGAMDFNFNRPLTVVYPDEATIMDLESAWTVYITLESATGRAADVYQMSDFAKLPDAAKRTVVFVSSDKNIATPTVRVENENKFVITGTDEKAVNAACMDFAVRYWKNAKDAGARKVGLVAAPAGEGGAKTDLD